MNKVYGGIAGRTKKFGAIGDVIFSFYQKYYVKVSIETKLIYFFTFIFLVLWLRLFYLQVRAHPYYEDKLINQHYSQTQLEPKRGNIYVLDKDDKPISLTKNIDLYEIYADPYVVYDKGKVATLLTPIVYDHFCTMYIIDKPSMLDCIKNVEKFTKEEIIEDDNTYMLVGTGENTIVTNTEEDELIEVEVSEEELKSLIKNRLSNLLEKKEITKIYIGFFENTSILDEIRDKKLSGVEISGYYLYVDLDKVSSKTRVAKELSNTLLKINSEYTSDYLEQILVKRPQRYVKLLSSVNPIWKRTLNELKEEYQYEKEDRVPLLHGIGDKKEPFRFYPYGTFLANVIGYVDGSQGKGGIEGYYDDILKGKKGKMVGMNTPWIGQIASNSLEIQQPEDGADIYLTIDYAMQENVEEIVKYYFNELRPDSISVTVMDPYNGDIKAMVTYPTFDVNYWKKVYNIKPLPNNYRHILSDETYYDIPVLVETGDNISLATTEERLDPSLKKYIFENIYGPRVFRNQNISDPYEPGSIFKTITVGIGIDSDSISLYDYYQDNGSLSIGPHNISNVEKACKGYHTYLHSLERSCNVGMVRIVQAIGTDVFYNYLQKIGFGKLTNIQLADEAPGNIAALDDFSYARFYSNSYGLGILVTPLQIAAAYSSMVNGGYLVKPTIVKKMDIGENTIENKKYIIDKVFGDKVTENIKYALWSTIYEGDLIRLAVDNFTFGGKTGTSGITYKGKPQGGYGWVRGSFAGIVTKEDTKYVVVIKVERPRTCEWGLCSAGKVFQDVGKWIVDYEGIKK